MSMKNQEKQIRANYVSPQLNTDKIDGPLFSANKRSLTRRQSIFILSFCFNNAAFSQLKFVYY